MILDHAAASLEDPASGSLLAAFQSLRATLIGSMPAWRHHPGSSRERMQHLGFTQPRALGRKVSDEFAVPLCRGYHRAADSLEPARQDRSLAAVGFFLLACVRVHEEGDHAGGRH